ncbi:hypothetical protein QVD17_29690 [Tagetes erecta]|uniref:Uncharacterized protein n=1 Tax=Tagetes erecta TaxID=13708 RepID=A0AAD8K1D6_TARER|nr:hypothetical protein QVD17_29690 [Tagetes erecta]
MWIMTDPYEDISVGDDDVVDNSMLCFHGGLIDLGKLIELKKLVSGIGDLVVEFWKLRRRLKELSEWLRGSINEMDIDVELQEDTWHLAVRNIHVDI